MAILLVTGGAGFIGSNFIHYWLKKYKRDSIVNFDKLTYAGHLENLYDIEDNPRYSFVKGDITKKSHIDKVIKDVDIVVNFAAESHVDRSIEDPMVFAKTNVTGTCVLLDACLRHGRKRFHHISTDEVYGELDINDPPFKENSPYDPKSPYSASKASSDFMVSSYFTAYGLPITITNCANNYGPFQDPEKLIPNFVTRLLENKKVPLVGQGHNVRSWLAVEDHCSAIDIVINNGKIGETYAIGGEEKTNLQVTKTLLKVLKKNESYIDFVNDRAVNDLRYAINDLKIRKLGWKPKYKFEKWIEKTVYWYEKNEWWWKPLIKSRNRNFLQKFLIDFKTSIVHNSFL